MAGKKPTKKRVTPPGRRPRAAPGGEEHVHASVVALGGRAVLLAGAPGIGKSDLALRLIDDGATLVSDDLARIIREGDELFALAPERMAGVMEVRGLGLIRMELMEKAPLKLVVDLVRDDAAIERLPEPDYVTFHDLPVMRVLINPRSASAQVRVRLALAVAESITDRVEES
jgi:serine kinase of HPr protein (carbohydrate metabolism regulator)